jgi:signal transduction histidine kinase
VDTRKNDSAVVALLKEIGGSGQLEHNLRRLDRLASAGTLAASMAHEIRNALVPIKTFVDLLLEKNPDAELSGMVKREISRIDTILVHMLSFGAPAAPVFVPVHLHRVLEHSLRLARHRIGGKVISIASSLNAGADRIQGDERQLEQAFVNLLINAVEAMASDGSLTVRTERVRHVADPALRETPPTAEFLSITIRDTGPGIAEENLQRVFEPFFTTKANGTGLGLAVTWRIIEQHKGTIRVESQPGKGTTFTVLLPAAPASCA